MRRPLAVAALIFCAAAWLITFMLPPPDPVVRAADGQELVCTGAVSDILSYTDTRTGQRVRLLYLQEAAWDGQAPEEARLNHSTELAEDKTTDNSEHTSIFYSEYNSNHTFLNTFQKYTIQSAPEGTCSIICRLDEESGLPRLGSRVRCEGKVRLFREATNPGEFHARNYYYGQGYAFELTDARVTGMSREYSLYRQMLYELKSHMGGAMERFLSAREASVVKAMLLGEKKGMDEEIKQLYQSAGISHVVAISGLHISILCMGAYRLFSRFLWKWVASLFSCIFLLSFLCMTGFSASSMRAGIMFVLLLAARLLGRTYDTPTALAVAAALLVIENPARLRETGFLLSFMAAFGASVVVPAIGRMDGWKEWKSRLRVGEGRRSQDRKNHPLRDRIQEGLRSSFCISMVTLPVVLTSFYEWNVLSVPVNLVVIPLMSVLLGGCIVLAAGGGILFPLGASETLFMPVVLPVKGILSLYEGLCRLAGWGGIGRFRPGEPAVWQILVFYALFLLLLFLRRRIPRAFAYLFLCLLSMVFMIRPRGTELTMLDVGQGDCIYIQSGQGRHYLYDGGSSSNSAAGTWQVIPFLKCRGVNRLELVFVSHWDTDHINAVEAVLEWAQEDGIEIGGLVLSGAGPWDELLEGLLNAAKGAGVPVYRMEAGERIEEKNCSFQALYPVSGLDAADKNAASLVLRYSEYREGRETFSALLTGDVEEEGERKMLTEGAKLESLFLKVAHHGSDTSSGREFLRAVRPKAALISCGRKNSYGHPHEAVLERLSEEGIPCYITSRCGAVTIYERDGKILLKTFLQK